MTGKLLNKNNNTPLKVLLGLSLTALIMFVGQIFLNLISDKLKWLDDWVIYCGFGISIVAVVVSVFLNTRDSERNQAPFLPFAIRKQGTSVNQNHNLFGSNMSAQGNSNQTATNIYNYFGNHREEIADNIRLPSVKPAQLSYSLEANNKFDSSDLDLPDLRLLRRIMINHFNLDELKRVADDLDVKPDSLPHDTRNSLTYALVEYFKHRRKLNNLIREILSLVEDPETKVLLKQMLIKLE